MQTCETGELAQKQAFTVLLPLRPASGGADEIVLVERVLFEFQSLSRPSIDVNVRSPKSEDSSLRQVSWQA